jgi:hypothetical protein
LKVRRLHSCRRTREAILETVFDGSNNPDFARQVQGCAECIEEYQMICSTLDLLDKGERASEPSPEYWAGYESRLQAAILSSAGAEWKRPNWVMRLFSSSVRIPIPVAAALLIVCAASVISLALRPHIVKTVEVPAAVSDKTIERIVEVPILQEKIVTKTVFVERKAPSAAKRVGFDPLHTSGLLASTAEEDGGSITRANLTGFHPTDDMRIRVLRRHEGDEK